MTHIVNAETMRAHKLILAGMDDARQAWFPHWRTLADLFLPRRYPWLLSAKELRTSNRQNKKLLDGTSILAIRTLASGLMNGITSPSRPWFRVRIPGFSEDTMSHAAKVYLDEVERRLLLIIAESNFYNSVAVLYLDWCCFGTASMAIYEDFEEVIRCFNFPLGEFYLTQDGSLRVNRHGRRFERTLEQLAGEFGAEALSDSAQVALKLGGKRLLEVREVAHIIEENNPKDGLLPHGANAPFREVYWEIGGEGYLAVRPLYEWPCASPRWELFGSDVYGSSPAMDAQGDVQQLQEIILKKHVALAKAVQPPMIVDQQLRNRPKAFNAGGITYAATANSNFGAKPAYNVQVPFQELAADIQLLKDSIREICYNPLFNMVSQLNTVRSATEIDALREEKLVHLGPVLERFQNEGLDPIIRRIFGIAQRAGLLPDPPPELAGMDIDVQYVSVLSDAQRSVGTISIERFFQFTGQLTGVYPEAREVANVEELIREYAEGIGVKPKGLKSRKEVAQNVAGQKQAAALAQTAATGKDLAQGAGVLAKAPVGGGQNALQTLLGG